MSFEGLSDCCLSGYVLPGSPKGTIIQLGGLDCYVATPEDPKPGAEDRAVVLFYDAFGWNTPNSKLISDVLADRLGVAVYCPDVLCGAAIPEHVLQPLIPDTAKGQSAFQTSLWTKITTVAGALPWVRAFMATSEAKTWPRCEKFLKALREEKKLAKIGAIGFCMGGRYSIIAGSTGLVEATVIAHPGALKGDFESYDTAIKVPSSFIVPEYDPPFPKTRQERMTAALEAKGVPFELVEYADCVHGFATRPALHEPAVKLAFEKALKQEEDWMRKWVVEA